MQQLDVRFRTAVERASKAADGSWEVAASCEGRALTFRSRVLVSAVGLFSVPRVPQLPGRELFGGETLHSSEYSSGAAYKGRRVLVVGAGNSGAEQLVDLWEHGASPTLLQRGASPFVPRWLIGVTQQVRLALRLLRSTL